MLLPMYALNLSRTALWRVELFPTSPVTQKVYLPSELAAGEVKK